MDPAHARELAASLVADVRDHGDDALRLDGVDLGPALEQQLFFALRDRRPVASRRLLDRFAAAVAPVGAAAVGAAARWRVVAPGPDPIVVLVRDPAHYPVLALVEGELQRLAGRALAMLRVGRAAGGHPPHAVAPRLVDLATPAAMRRAVALRRPVAAALDAGSRAWAARLPAERAEELRRLAGAEMARIAVGAAGLLAAAERWGPALLVALDEVGTWARILPAVGRRLAVPTLDLPHAEAADPIAIRGASYDQWAVYGPRAARVLEAAGIGPERIHEIGAPRFDPLVALVAERGAADGTAPATITPRVVFAAQYATGRMTDAVHRQVWTAAVAVAAARAPSELVVVPHPAEPPGTAATLATGEGAEGVTVRVSETGALHGELVGAALLVTGWSNSVFEAAIAGVPAIAVDPGGVAPVDFAADGLALGARGPDDAAAAARALLDDARRRTTVARARAVTAERLGALDGRASERAAALLLAVARIADA